MNRRFLALALAGTLALSLLAGCGSSGSAETPAPESSAPVAESNTPIPAPSETPDAGGEMGGAEEAPTPDSSAPIPDKGNPPAEGSTAPETGKPTEKPSQTPGTKPSQPPAPSAPVASPTPTPVPPEESAPVGDPSLVQDIWSDISALDLPALMELDADTLSALYGIDSADLEDYVCMMPMMNVQATEFFIAKVKDGRMDAVKASVQSRQADLEAEWSQYLPAQLELVQNYKLVTNGNYILFAISTHADKAVEIFNSYTK